MHRPQTQKVKPKVQGGFVVRSVLFSSSRRESASKWADFRKLHCTIEVTGREVTGTKLRAAKREVPGRHSVAGVADFFEMMHESTKQLSRTFEVAGERLLDFECVCFVVAR